MDKINFTINGTPFNVSGAEVGSNTSLNEFIRNTLQMHGTKGMCYEGGCGACVVTVTQTHPVTKEKCTFSVNSCLVQVLSCHDWDITTVEGVGNRKDGYHPIQRTLAAFNGTQCGYCTSGWVMNMYSLYQSKGGELTKQQLEDSFGGSLCRCTGYRFILDALKTFAIDADPTPNNKLQDVEGLTRTECGRNCSRKCSESDDWCLIHKTPQTMMIMATAEGQWYKAFSIQDVIQIWKREGSNSYRLVSGNTGQGVYRDTTEPRIFIDVSTIDTLKSYFLDANLVIGAGTTLTELMNLFQSYSRTDDFKYLDTFYKHLDLVAHVPVRNIGSIAGNIAMKNLHPEFPSDVFLLLRTVGATVSLVDINLKKSELKMQDFLNTDLRGNLITEVKLPPLAADYLIRTYKTMPRAQNAHAIVNAGFLFKVDLTQKVESATIVYGNISSTFINAQNTEATLVGLELFTDDTLMRALKKLDEEIIPEDMPPESSPSCRKDIALGLFYKAMLSLAPSVNPRYKSGGEILERAISHGMQLYDTDKSLWPLNQPVPKVEALKQCAGEVKYSCDLTLEPQAVHVAFVLSTISLGEIESIDATEALKVPGVVAFYTAADIPGKNSFTSPDVPKIAVDEEILASKKIVYYGQPIGVIAATTHRIANSAVGLVKVTYIESTVKPVFTVREALAAPDKDLRMREDTSYTPTRRGTDIKHVIKGSFTVPSQYHFTMETQCCTVSYSSTALVVRSATQWMDLVNVTIARALNISQNEVIVEVPRVGGAYGAKASRSSLAACACALVAHKLNRSAMLVMPLTTNMTALGLRQQCECDYEAGVNAEGVIQYLDLRYYSDCGYNYNDTSANVIGTTVTNLYDSSTWNVKGYSVLTDKCSCTWCRGPGGTEGVAIAEQIMEHIASATGKDPADVRIANIAPQVSVVKDMITTFKQEVDYDNRRAAIDKFNSENAWRKKGLSLSTMAYPITYDPNFPVTVTVYQADATVAISHGGIEVGQGINTKVAQVCAYSLKIPLEKVVVHGSNSFVSPNTMVTNGSMTSDLVAYATVRACEELLRRFEDVKKDLTEPTWEEVVKAAFNKGIHLQASHMMSDLDGLQEYSVYGVCVSEVELDVLTGNHILNRVDILEDTGISMSPEIDVGQIEGAFIMGLGLWTSEKLIYDSTGRLLTNRTWTYKPPCSKDIPVDFRVSFRRNAPNPAGVLRSKATGEPALTLAVGVTHALRGAILDARKEFGYNDTEWLHIDTPFNVESIMKALSIKLLQYREHH